MAKLPWDQEGAAAAIHVVSANDETELAQALARALVEGAPWEEIKLCTHGERMAVAWRIDRVKVSRLYTGWAPPTPSVFSGMGKLAGGVVVDVPVDDKNG